MVERTIGGERSREWADRPPLSTSDAAGELRTLESQGVLEPRASRAVLVAAGHGEEEAPVGPRPANPGGLARREVDVLRLAAKRLTTRRLTTKQIADRLFISTKTADHHIQHVYNKIGASREVINGVRPGEPIFASTYKTSKTCPKLSFLPVKSQRQGQAHREELSRNPVKNRKVSHGRSPSKRSHRCHAH
jgi:DNA-binding CsgD family transcriptional regulator